MKSNELRVGNWVSLDGSCKRVLWFKYNKVCVMNGYPSAIVDIDRLNPIELTEEILLKCGFEKRSDGHFNIFEQNEVDIIICNDFSSWKCDGVNFSVNYIKYLHQLQNLYFALTGEELEINI